MVKASDTIWKLLKDRGGSGRRFIITKAKPWIFIGHGLGNLKQCGVTREWSSGKVSIAVLISELVNICVHVRPCRYGNAPRESENCDSPQRMRLKTQRNFWTG